MTLFVTDETRKIIFHAKDLEINKESISVTKLGDTRKIPIADNDDYDPYSQRFTITMNEDLVHDETYEMTLEFTGYLKNNMQGFYRSSYLQRKTNQTR